MRKQRFQFAASRIIPESAKETDVYLLQALLSRYGHLTEPFTPGKFDDATRRGVMQFQSFYRLAPQDDGICDEATINLLNQPRCGVSDRAPVFRSAIGRLAPYRTVGAKWSTNTLRFRFMNSTPDLGMDRQHAIIREAFSRWAGVCALTFNEVLLAETSELSVGFHRGSHGDSDPFDDAGGPDGNTLAHAYFPPPAGDRWAGSLHFDEYEQWKDAPGGTGTRLYNVALHEIGHLLGLAHSPDTNAIMYAYYAEDRNDLRADDIAGAQSLYGAPATAPVALSVGEKVSGTLPQTNAEVRYQVTLQNKLLIKLDGPSGQDFDLYVRYGQPAGTGEGAYDAVGYGSTADESIAIENPKAGTYYILVQSYRGSGRFDLEADVA